MKQSCIMPKGEYWIGDLCYVLHNSWDEFCRHTIRGDDVLNGKFVLDDNRKLAFYQTAWGDGVYEDDEGFEYAVDAGLIGCIKASEVDKDGMLEHCGRKVMFDQDFEVSEENGMIRFGHIRIDTDPDTNYDEEDYL